MDIVVHSLANGPEVQKPLLETSRRGYLAAMSASSYSFVSMMQVWVGGWHWWVELHGRSAASLMPARGAWAG